MHNIREYILGLDPAMEESPKKFYVAYKISQNIVCMEAQNKNIKLSVKLRSKDINNAPNTYRDVSKVGHFGTGDSEFTISTDSDFEETKSFIELAYIP